MKLIIGDRGNYAGMRVTNLQDVQWFHWPGSVGIIDCIKDKRT